MLETSTCASAGWKWMVLPVEQKPRVVDRAVPGKQNVPVYNMEYLQNNVRRTTFQHI